MKPDNPHDWLKRAKSNLIRAKTGKISDEILYEDLCFDAQQSAEKSLKALLVHKNRPFPKTHTLHALFSLVEETGVNVPEDILEAGILTEYAVETRYPGDYIEIDNSEYEKAVKLAEKVFEWAEGIIKKR